MKGAKCKIAKFSKKQQIFGLKKEQEEQQLAAAQAQAAAAAQTTGLQVTDPSLKQQRKAGNSQLWTTSTSSGPWELLTAVGCLVNDV